MGEHCERDSRSYPPSPTGSDGLSAPLLSHLLSVRDWARPCRWRGGELFWGSAHTQCKRTDLLWEPQPVLGPTHCEEQQGKQMCNSVSGWNVKRPGICAYFLTAVCEPGCGLYGTCAEPNKCQCKEGWHGRHCNKSKWETNPRSPYQGPYTSDAVQKCLLQEPF